VRRRSSTAGRCCANDDGVRAVPLAIPCPGLRSLFLDPTPVEPTPKEDGEKVESMGAEKQIKKEIFLRGCFELLLSFDNVKRTYSGTTTPLAEMLLGRVHNSVCLTFTVQKYA